MNHNTERVKLPESEKGIAELIGKSKLPQSEKVNEIVMLFRKYNNEEMTKETVDRILTTMALNLSIIDIENGWQEIIDEILYYLR